MPKKKTNHDFGKNAERRCDWCGASPSEMGPVWTLVTIFQLSRQQHLVVCAWKEECHVGAAALRRQLNDIEWGKHIGDPQSQQFSLL